MDNPQPDFRAIHDALVKELITQGKLLEGGFMALRFQLYPTAPKEQIDELKLAYMAGAQHLFASMMAGGVLDDEPGVSASDILMMTNLNTELETWEKVLQARARAAGPTQH